MSCKKCQQKKPCTTTNDCACEVYLTSDCVNNVKTEFECLNISNGLSLTETLEAMDEQICVKLDTITNYFTLINIGSGAEVYKGVNNLGQKELRTIVKEGDLVTVEEGENTIIIGIDEEALNTFIETNQKTVVVSNAGTIGETLVKTAEVSGDETTYPIKRLIHSEQDGEGESFVRDLQVNTDDLTLRTKKLKSNTLSITATEEEITIDTPMSAQIPALYVNTLYAPTYEEWLAENKAQNSGVAVSGFEFIGKGTLAQPFTETRVYPLLGGSPTITSNSAIQNALDGDDIYSYVGDSGTYDRLNPEKAGQKIIIQNNNSNYTFAGNLNYTDLYVVHENNVNYTTTGYLIDMDDTSAFDSEDSRITLEIKEGITIQVDGAGFRNSGNTSTTPPSYTTGRVCILLGDGEIYNEYNGVNNLTKYLFNGDGNNNDDDLHFQVRCKVRASYQGIYKTVNNMRIDFYNQLTSGIFLGVIDTDIQAFHMEGGQIRFYEKGSIALSSGTSGRLYGITFDPIEDCNFQLNSAKVRGTSENCFVKLSDGNVSFLAFNSPSGDMFSTTLMGTNTITKGLFENLGSSPWGIDFKNNVFSFTGIDFDKVDLTQGNGTSSINFIGNSTIETLVIHSNKENARASLPTNSAFLLQRDVNASDLVAGTEYKIKVAGTGTPLGTVGTYFIATGLESAIGGVATLIERAIVL